MIQGAVLALDLGTKTGYAVSTFDKKEVYESGVANFALKRHEGEGMRFFKFRLFLDSLWSSMGPFEEVVYEDVKRHAGTQAAHIYGGFRAHMQAWCEPRDVTYKGFGVGTIKKYATGRGNALKDEVILSMLDRGYDPKDDNEADALAILLCRLGL